MKKCTSLSKKYYIALYVLSLMLLFQPAYSQKKHDDVIYLLKSDWSGAKDMNEARYIMQVIKENDTNYICRFYNKTGPMVRQEVYLDSGLSVPNGIFCWYNTKGNMDSIGGVYRGKKNGFWDYYNDSSQPTVSIRYDMNRVIEKRDYLLNIYIDTSGNRGDLKEKEKAEHNAFLADSIAGKLQPATFGKKNSPKEWQRYMDKEITPSERFATIFKTGCCSVICSFNINVEGNIEEVYLVHSCEWSADAEVIKAIQKGPKWNAAIRNGKTVSYRQKQSITFCAD